MVSLRLPGGGQRGAGCLVDDSGAVPVTGQLRRLDAAPGQHPRDPAVQVTTATRGQRVVHRLPQQVVADPEPARVHPEQIGTNSGLERAQRVTDVDTEHLGDLVLVAALVDHGGNRHRVAYGRTLRTRVRNNDRR
jgi:hypothetical protein